MQVSSHATGLRTRQGFTLKVAARPTVIAGNGYKNHRARERRSDRSSDTIGYRIGKFCVLHQANPCPKLHTPSYIDANKCC